MVLSPRIKTQANEPSRRPGLIYFADIIKFNDIANVVHEKYACAGEAVRRAIITFYLWAISLIFLIVMNML
jgi:hypothetical protein